MKVNLDSVKNQYRIQEFGLFLSKESLTAIPDNNGVFTIVNLELSEVMITSRQYYILTNLLPGIIFIPSTTEVTQFSVLVTLSKLNSQQIEELLIAIDRKTDIALLSFFDKVRSLFFLNSKGRFELTHEIASELKIIRDFITSAR